VKEYTFTKIANALKNRYFLKPEEKTFLHKIKLLKGKNGDRNYQDVSKGVFFVEAIGVNQIMCLNQCLSAKAGESEGLMPVIIMQYYIRKHKRLFDNAGIRNIEIMLLNITLLDRIRAFLWAKKVYKTLKTPEDLLNFSYDGITMGGLVYSSYLFRHMTGTVFKIIPEIKRYLSHCYLNYLYYKRLFNKYTPQFTVLTNNTYIECGTLFQMSINKNIPAYVVGWPVSNRVIIKRYDKDVNIDDLSIINPTQAEWEIILQNKKSQWVENGKKWMEKRYNGEDMSFGGADAAVGKPLISKKAIYDLLGIDSTKKIVLVCSHVMWDDPVIYTNLYRDYYWWWVETAKIANEIEDVYWVFKAHPGEWDTLGRKTDQIPIRSLDVLKSMNLKPHIKFLDSGLTFNNYSLMQIVDALVTIRGTVGVEYSCMGIPVVVAGTGSYTCADFAIQPNSIEEYKYVLKNINSLEKLSQETIDRALMFAYFCMGEGLSASVKGTADNFDITQLKDTFYQEFREDQNWNDMIKNMMAHKDCRSIPI
jgi:hypothetical protein